VGILFGYGVTIVYFFRRKPIDRNEKKVIADAEVTRMMKALSLPSEASNLLKKTK
jgi:hypothetical protein